MVKQKPTIFHSCTKLFIFVKEEAITTKTRSFYFIIAVFLGWLLIAIDYYISTYIWRYQQRFPEIMI